MIQQRTNALLGAARPKTSEKAKDLAWRAASSRSSRPPRRSWDINTRPCTSGGRTTDGWKRSISSGETCSDDATSTTEQPLRRCYWNRISKKRRKRTLAVPSSVLCDLRGMYCTKSSTYSWTSGCTIIWCRLYSMYVYIIVLVWYYLYL